MDLLTGIQIKYLLRTLLIASFFMYFVSVVSRTLGFFAIDWGTAQVGSRYVVGKIVVFLIQEIQGLTALPVIGVLFVTALCLWIFANWIDSSNLNE